MKSLVQKIDRSLEWLLIVLMALMVVDVSWQVFSRFILKAPSSYTEEIARFLLIWIGLLGASYAYKTRAHLGIDILVSRLPKHRQLLAFRAVHLVSALFALVVMVFGGLRLVFLALELKQTSAALRLPMGYVYLVVPISGLFILFYAARFMFGEFKNVK